MSSLTLKTIVGTISTVLITTFMISSAYSQTKSNYTGRIKPKQARHLNTDAATIDSQWNLIKTNVNSNSFSLEIQDPECKKINPIEYINDLESFFKSCETTIDANKENYEPIEYLKVPELDFSINLTVTNFE